MKHSILNEKQKRPQPEYSYCPRRSRWAVYNDETGIKVCEYSNKEEARKKVYELNGWKYTPPKNKSK